MAEQSKKNASNQAYKNRNTKCITARFFPTDMPLYDYVKSRQEGVTPYIKRLIREDMERNGVEYVPNPARSPHWRSKQKED